MAEDKIGEFVVEYIGDLMDVTEPMKKEYSNDVNIGFYMYYFNANSPSLFYL